MAGLKIGFSSKKLGSNRASAAQNRSFLEKIEVEHHCTAEKARFPLKISELSVTAQLKIEISSKNTNLGISAQPKNEIFL